MYDPEKGITVMCNETPAILLLPLKDVDRAPVQLFPKGSEAYVDVEEIASVEELKFRMRQFRLITEQGKVSWHKRGSKPVPKPQQKIKLQRYETIIAPPNQYDDKLVAAKAKEDRRNERSLQGGGGDVAARRTTEDVVTPPPADAAIPTMSAGPKGADTVMERATTTTVAATTPEKLEPVIDPTEPATPVIDVPGEPLDLDALLKSAVDAGLVNKKGTWFRLASGKKLGQGVDRTLEFLAKTPEVVAELQAKLKG